MLGFDIKQSLNTIKNSILNYNNQLKINVYRELNSDGYKHILKSFSFDENNNFKFVFQDDIDIQNQDFLEVFAQGGNIKKGDELIGIKPSKTIRKYLGKR